MNVFYMSIYICFNECVCIYIYVYEYMRICGFVGVRIYKCFWYVGVLREIIKTEKYNTTPDKEKDRDVS